MGYRDVLNTIHESYEYIPIRANYILQLHRDLYQYSEKGIGGSFKNTQNFISATDAEELPAVEVVRRAVCGKIGKFTKSDIMELCPTIGKTSVESSIKKLVDSGVLVKHGAGHSTFYTRSDAQ